MNDFLNPKSMSTPGAAGALMMLIANAFCSNFPECPFRYVALALSFAIGAVVFSAKTLKVWERGIYWLVNSLIIFSMGVGASNIAANLNAGQAAPRARAAVLEVLTGTAFAQEGRALTGAGGQIQGGAEPAAGQSKPLSKAELEKKVRELEAQVRALKEADWRMADPSDQKAATGRQQEVQVRAVEKAEKQAESGGFFKRW